MPTRYEKRTVSTALVRAHPDDWPLIRQGIKREFRMPMKPGNGRWFNVHGPLPCAVYTQITQGGDYRTNVMILERVWSEPLFALSPDSLAAEGFDTFEEFRAYWMRREGARFRASRNVWAFQVRPMVDSNEAGRLLLERLYWEHL